MIMSPFDDSPPPPRPWSHWVTRDVLNDALEQRILCLLQIAKVLRVQLPPTTFTWRRRADLPVQAAQIEPIFAAAEVLVAQVFEKIQEIKARLQEVEAEAALEQSKPKPKAARKSAKRKRSRTTKASREEEDDEWGT